MIIPESNAFTINLLSSTFFPLSIEVSQKENITSAFLCAQRVVDICDIIEKYAMANLILFGMDQYSLYDEHEERPYSLERITAGAQVPCSVIDSGTVVLAKETLKSLLSSFSQSNLFTMDIENEWNENDVIRKVITCLEHDWRTQNPLLLKLPASQNFIHSHDDCYLTIETQHPSFVRQIFARMLQIYAGTVWTESNKAQLDMSEIPTDILLSIWEENFGLTILRKTTEVKSHSVRMGVAKRSFSFREEIEYIPEFWIRYDVPSQKWLIE